MVVDSSVWLEILRGGSLKSKCEKAMLKQKLRVPTVVIFEIYKKLKVKAAEDVAMDVVASLSQYEVLDLSREVAVLAGDLAIEHGLAMADSLVLAHALATGDTLLTLDNDFAKISGATVIR